MIPRLLICEGPEDHYFFQKLIEARGLPRFHIRHSDGNTKFANAISRFQLERTKIYADIIDILIVADNDDAPDDMFANVCKQIEAKFGVGAAPLEPLQPTNGRPRCTVLMIPWAKEEGNLERLCVEAARSADKIVGTHVDHFLALLAAENWPGLSRYGKAWLRVNLAGRCDADPFIPLGKVFNEPRHEGLIPLNDPSFNRIADVLARIGQA